MDSSAGLYQGGSNSSSSFQAGVLNPTWVESLRQKLKTKPKMLVEAAGSKSCCIHRVPPTIRQHDEKAYTPLVVSLGPLHRNNQMLQAMEEHKWRYLDRALSRATDNGLESYLTAIKELEQSARECYSEIIQLDSDEFVEMMVLDGCFVVEILLVATQHLTADPNDPVFNQRWIMDRIGRDMLLLENQVPFFLLERLFDLMTSSMQIRDSLVSICLRCFPHIGKYNHSYHINPKHLLHLLQSCVLPDSNRLPSNPTLEAIPCAKQLHEAGVKFKKSDADNFFDIKFEEEVMEIPPIHVVDGTYSLFLNPIAFEQCYRHCNQCITAYTTFMDWLVNSAEEVLILCFDGIIQNWLGSDEEVADLFNKLGRDVIIFEHCFYLSDVVKRINSYCSTPWHAWRASLLQKYFYNPWAIISLIGASILLFLTFIQTFFAAFSYSNPPS